MEGVKQIKASDISARFVFVAPPNEEELEKRLRGRGTEKEESIQKRLTQAKYAVPSRAPSAMSPALPLARLPALTLECRLELEYSKTPGVHDIIVSLSHPTFPNHSGEPVRYCPAFVAQLDVMPILLRGAHAYLWAHRSSTITSTRHIKSWRNTSTSLSTRSSATNISLSATTT